MRRLAFAAVAAALTLAPLAAQGAPSADPGVFQGLGTWVDIYDGAVYRAPEAVAAKIAARGVRTVYVETANDRSTVDVVDPVGLGRFVDALHGQGVRVVGWYLPGFVKPAVDLRRTRAMLSFRTPSGGAFDGVALDIESLRLKSAGLRTQRLLALSRILRAEAGELPVAAITYPSRALRAPPEVVARLPVAEADAARRRLDPDDVHGRRLPRLRRHVRLRRPLAPVAPARCRP